MTDTTRERHRTIIVATDFSVASQRALEWGVELAARRRAELVLLHAVTSPGATEATTGLAWTLTEELLAAAGRRLDELAMPLRQRVPVLTTEVALGPPAEAILHAVAHRTPELLVVGTRGLRGWRHVLLGSTAERLLGRATCPVLAVHEADPPPPAHSLRLLAPTDFSADATQASAAAARLFGDAVAEVVLLHAFHVPLPAPPAEAFLDGDLMLGLRASASQALDDEVAKVATTGAAGDRVRAELRDGYPAEVIPQVARELAVDLIVMGTRGHGGIAHLLLGSCAERVTQLATCPVLSVSRRAWHEAAVAPVVAPWVPEPVDQEC